MTVFSIGFALPDVGALTEGSNHSINLLTTAQEEGLRGKRELPSKAPVITLQKVPSCHRGRAHL